MIYGEKIVADYDGNIHKLRLYSPLKDAADFKLEALGFEKIDLYQQENPKSYQQTYQNLNDGVNHIVNIIYTEDGFFLDSHEASDNSSSMGIKSMSIKAIELEAFLEKIHLLERYLNGNEILYDEFLQSRRQKLKERLESNRSYIRNHKAGSLYGIAEYDWKKILDGMKQLNLR